jgi:hypothetical protein
VETYLKYSEAIGVTGMSARPMVGPAQPTDMDRVLAENVELRKRLEELS